MSKNKILTPEEWLNEKYPFWENASNILILLYMKEYSIYVRDITLDIAAENAEARMTNEFDVTQRKPQVFKIGIYALKNSKDLEI